jgi:putative transposase
VQPLRAHEHWHVDVSYINISGTFYYLSSLLDGHSRFIVHWEIREAMTERDIETVVQRALKQHPNEKPRIIRACGQIVGKSGKRRAVLSRHAVKAREGLGCIGTRLRMISGNVSGPCCPDRSESRG